MTPDSRPYCRASYETHHQSCKKKKKNSKKYVNKVSQTMSSRKGGAIFPLKKQYVCLVKCKYKIIIIINNNNLFLIRRK